MFKKLIWLVPKINFFFPVRDNTMCDGKLSLPITLIVNILKHSGGSITLWSCFYSAGTVRADETIDEPEYREEHLLEAVNNLVHLDNFK